MSPVETGLYYLQSRYYDPALCRFLNADGLASTGQGILGCNMFAYCGNNPVTREDMLGRLDEKSSGENNEENIRCFFGLSEDDDIPEIEEGCMLLLENITYITLPQSPISFVRGHAVIFDKEKYCEYYYYGFCAAQSGAKNGCYGYEEVLGYVYGVKNVEDYSGLFFGASYNSSIDASGGAIAPNKVYSKYKTGEALYPSLGVSVTYYFSTYSDWQYGKVSINWHPSRASMVFQRNPEDRYLV